MKQRVKWSPILLLMTVMLSIPGEGARAEQHTFEDPKIKGVQLDWCKRWGEECGKPAADLFCSQQGFEFAQKFEIATDIGSPQSPTIVLADGRLCNASYCDGFRYIQCTRQDTNSPRQRSFAPVQNVASPRDPSSKPDVRESATEKSQVFVPPAMLGGQPDLVYCQTSTCEFALPVDLTIDPAGRTQAQTFQTDFSNVKNATAARFEVSTYPISQSVKSVPKDLVSAGAVQNNGTFTVDLIKARDAAGRIPGSFYVRVIALDKPAGQQVGAASPVLRIYYADNMPPTEPIEIFSEKVLSSTPEPKLRLESFDYSAFRFVDSWPPNCKPIPRDTGTHGLQAASQAAGKTWDAATGVYAAAKNGVIVLASTMTFGVVPDSILELALNTALIAAGIPPEIPNLNKLMNEGAGYFASEMAKMAVSQIPAGDLVAATGNLAMDITVEMAAEMTEQELRDRLEDEIRKQSKLAIEQAAKQAEQDMIRNAKNTYCRGKSYWPTYTVRLKNTGPETVRDVSLTVSDEAELFEPMTVDFSLDSGETVTIPLMPNPNVRVVERSQLSGYDESANRAIWWDDDYRNKKTRVILQHSGATTCVDPLGPDTYACSTGTVNLLRTPDRGTLNKNRKFK